MGSILAARHAGMELAANATTWNGAAMPAKVAGSVALTWKSRVVNSRAASSVAAFRAISW